MFCAWLPSIVLLALVLQRTQTASPHCVSRSVNGGSRITSAIFSPVGGTYFVASPPYVYGFFDNSSTPTTPPSLYLKGLSCTESVTLFQSPTEDVTVFCSSPAGGSPTLMYTIILPSEGSSLQLIYEGSLPSPAIVPWSFNTSNVVQNLAYDEQDAWLQVPALTVGEQSIVVSAFDEGDPSSMSFSALSAALPYLQTLSLFHTFSTPTASPFTSGVLRYFNGSGYYTDHVVAGVPILPAYGPLGAIVQLSQSQLKISTFNLWNATVLPHTTLLISLGTLIWVPQCC